MTKPINVNAPGNSSYYDSSDQVCRGPDGTGGASPASGAGGSHGAGNIDQPQDPSGNLQCLPEVVDAVDKCGKALLVRNLTAGLQCGISLANLHDCLTSGGD